MLLLNQRLVVKAGGFVSLRIFQVPEPVSGSDHNYKYSLTYVVDDICVLRYDNEVGKGDHKHLGDAVTCTVNSVTVNSKSRDNRQER